MPFDFAISHKQTVSGAVCCCDRTKKLQHIDGSIDAKMSSGFVGISTTFLVRSDIVIFHLSEWLHWHFGEIAIQN